MAIKEATEFIKKLAEDEALRSAFQADPEGTLAAGGYGCTKEEVNEAILMSRELDEKELYAVAGGTWVCSGIGGPLPEGKSVQGNDPWDCGRNIGGPLPGDKNVQGNDPWDCGGNIGGPLHVR